MAYALPDPPPSLDRYDEPRLHMEKFLSIKLVEFDISPRILFPLADNGIVTIGDLVKSSPRELAKIKNIGASSIAFLRKFLDHHYLYFGMKQG